MLAETADPQQDWSWLSHYLQTELDFAAVLRTFPLDEPMSRAVEACAGLRLLRQDPWECLASRAPRSAVLADRVPANEHQVGPSVTPRTECPARWPSTGPEAFATSLSLASHRPPARATPRSEGIASTAVSPFYEKSA